MSGLKRKRVDTYLTSGSDVSCDVRITDSRFPGQGYRLGCMEELKAKCQITQFVRNETLKRDREVHLQYALYVGRP